ncbi:hypothetical protein SO802_027609 [Lithocarpus litseifolius]|uniref:Uncharacterized protein n=1 Tax=Lithocarpus litseifolius TaxID=425828 RepID=A0AAW2C659_9ROSI
MATAVRLVGFGINFVGVALAVNCYQNHKILNRLDLIIEEEQLIRKRINEINVRTYNLEVLAAKLDANCTQNLKALLAKLGAKEV